ncbi:MAG: peptide ABC transporter ATP-binding protein [Deltaproteobacteria bacterium CG11_big_fil_rev_8_21_14_0_20_47_16]|nr:MAG: peptide ABC transporter ATP-binding protein [Deltaproteobacteria bacterium CG11_big_fil_rev_8_21_14_0_20_47_16]
MSLLDVQNLTTEFRMRDGLVRAVNNVSFSLEPGQVLGIVGESGSGKSVTNMSLLRLIPQPPGRIVSGTAKFKGTDLLQMPMNELRKIRGKDIAMIFQDPMTSLNPFLRISTQMCEVLEVHEGLSSKLALKRAIEMMEVVGIPAAERRIHDYPHQFSGGMRQRVMIAMALLCNPSLLIADEPTTALDVTIQAQILDLLAKLRREFNMAMILITHNLGVVAGVADSIAVMYAGEVVERAPTDQLFAQPTHPYTQGLLKSVPRLDETTRSKLAPIRDQPPDLSHLPHGCPFHPRCDACIDKCRHHRPQLESCGDRHEAACWVTAPGHGKAT